MNSEKLPSYGGQALIEGIMMRGSLSVAAAMRNPEGEIVIHTEKLGKLYQSRIKKIPFLRGLLILWDSLGLGVRFLTLSANTQTSKEEKIDGPLLYLTIAVSLAIAILLFFVAPAAAVHLLDTTISWNPWVSNLLEGIVRLLIIIVYIWAIGKLPDVNRVFAYHGAEHKTINAFEAGAELTRENVARYPLEHPRCGTSFLLTLVTLSIILFSLLGPLPIAGRLISRVLLLPVLASLAYEYIRWSANHMENRLVRLLIRPNLALQRLTTREPDEKMIEIGIASLKAGLEHETPERQSSSLIM